MNTPNSKALIYCRVSSKKQEIEGGGLGSQEKRCREYAESKGYIVDSVFHDSFSGAGDFMKRPAMRQLLEYVDKNPQIYVVIFDDLKRFARDLKFHWELRAEFQLRNLTPKCLNFTFEETPEGAFIETIIAAQGELERQQNKRQTIQKMKARMQRGIFCLAKAPYGYVYSKNIQYGGKVLEIHPQDADVIHEAFNSFAIGKFPNIKDVSDYITAHKKNKSDEIVRQDTARKMLTNIFYAGYIEYPKWHIPLMKGIHKPIISMETYQKIQERLTDKIPQRSRKDIKIDFPLRGHINCNYCNKPLTACWAKSKTGAKHPYYYCYSKMCVYKGKSIPQKHVHEHFLSFIQNLTPRKDILHRTKMKLLKEAIKLETNLSQKVEQKIKLKAELDIEFSGLIKQISKNVNSPLVEAYEEELCKIKEQQMLLQEEILKTEKTDIEKFEPLVDKALKPFKSPYITWVKGNLRKRKLIQNILFKTNLNYERKDGFRTQQKTEILSLFEEIEAESDHKILYAGTKEKTSNSLTNSTIYIREHWDKLMDEIKKSAEIQDDLEASNLSE